MMLIATFQVEGISTIRAFGWEEAAVSENNIQLDDSQRPDYLLLSLQRWLNLVLDLTIAGIAVGVVGLAVRYRGSTTGGQVGVALNVVLLANATLIRLVETWTTMETSLGAIARIKSMERDTPRESDQQERSAGDDWPRLGRLRVEHVTASYG